MSRSENPETKEQKLANKLRENLKRRKAQTKRRKSGQSKISPSSADKSG